MNIERYSLKSDEDLTYFEFISEGPKGLIRKVVQYSPTNLKDFYNLGFGDKTDSGEISDMVVSNNNDSQKILATVASTVYAFTVRNPEAWVFATGSNKVRTRLYRMGINNNLLQIQKDFDIFGLRDDVWEDFQKDVEYQAFLLHRKTF